jgi:hypothetical protein
VIENPDGPVAQYRQEQGPTGFNLQRTGWAPLSSGLLGSCKISLSDQKIQNSRTTSKQGLYAQQLTLSENHAKKRKCTIQAESNNKL